VSYPATIVYDNLVNVEVRNSGGALMYQGKLLDRVTRNAAGVLEFRSQLRDVTPGFNGIASSIDRLNMAPYTTSVSFDPTSAGTVSPFLASRTAAPGTTVKWRYPTTVSSSATTKFAAITTNATSYNTRGVAVVTLQTGDSVILTGIAQPGAGSPRASITGPAPLSCDCNPITITGTADADGSMASYTLEYSTSPTGPWNTIVTSTTPVTGERPTQTTSLLFRASTRSSTIDPFSTGVSAGQTCAAASSSARSQTTSSVVFAFFTTRYGEIRNP
jgi:hypothetical protein